MPGQDAAEEIERINEGLGFEGRVAGADDQAEDRRVDDHQQQGVEKGPEEPEDGAPVPRLELPDDQVLDQDPVLVELLEVSKNTGHVPLPRRSPSSRACIHPYPRKPTGAQELLEKAHRTGTRP